MSSHTDDPDLARYYAFVRAHPEHYVNPEGGVTVLLERDEIRAIEEGQADRLQARGLPREWARIGVHYEDQYVLVVRDAVRFPDGSPGTYFRILTKPFDNGGAVVLPLYQGRVVLLRHFRHSTRTWHLEAPRGSAEPGQTKEDVARREVAEELGGVVASLTSLGALHVSTSYFRDTMGMFLAELSEVGEPALEEGITGLVQVSPAEFERMIVTDQVTDSHTLAAYGRAKAMGVL
ncbi:MAG: NUDIX hydrolase [Alphaproteobacteria bacterium]